MSISFTTTKRPSRQSQAGKTKPAPSRLVRKVSKILSKLRGASDKEEGQLPNRVKRIASSSGGGNSRRRKLNKPLDEESENSNSVDTPAKAVVLSRIS
ncbi:MAG: hypothetical protein KR126chlam3_00920 [Chlamydiae bacterium]|nr:hypothetical protein [Chlamydiota bacterium]